ncbi:expressed unknown protein [Seminavis robusta]|uniref:Uncharacterized protein n=1 Tax=Seminavis robusta TaxID=568900 RepID=A0A9N8DB74_9STRA|nr:expressed unknown protein [Seminavis robusta]|eukprot:Sro6_g005050.1 n/a (551) ;mRNA; f:84918-86570
MDSIVLEALDGGWMRDAWMRTIQTNASHCILDWIVLPAPSSASDNDNPCNHGSSSTLSSLEMVFWTYLFCILLTGILLLLCHLYPSKELELVLDDSSIASHVQSLRSNQNTLRKVAILAFQHYAKTEIIPIFQELADVPQLLAVSMDLRFLPLSILTFFLQQPGAQKLKDLSLFFRLTRDTAQQRQEIEVMATVVQTHPSLSSISIESSCRGNTRPTSTATTATNDWLLDPLILALSNVPTLHSLFIYNLQSSTDVYNKLFQSTTLCTLEIAVYTTSTQSMTMMLSPSTVKLLASNGTLKTLKVPLLLSRETCTAWAHVIQHNKSLHTLTLIGYYSSQRQQGCAANKQNIKGTCLLPVLKALACNSSIEHLTVEIMNSFKAGENNTDYNNDRGLLQEHNHHFTAVDNYNTNHNSSHSLTQLTTILSSPCVVRALAWSLTRNKAIKSIRIGPFSDSTAAILQDTLVPAIQYNLTLETLELFASNRSVVWKSPVVEFYLQCNRLGRANVLLHQSSSSPSSLVDFLIQPQVDVRTMFHILSERPEALMQLSRC